MYIALYSPSSVQKITDFLKTVYLTDALIPVIIKPIGAAAQIGIPEAHKIAYRSRKPILVLPEIRDLVEILKCDNIYYIDEDGEGVDLKSVFREDDRTAIIINAGDLEPSKKEIESLKRIWPHRVPKGIPSTALVGIFVYLYFNLKSPSNVSYVNSLGNSI